MNPLIFAAALTCAQMTALDGDTLKGCGQTVRLFGVNSPEIAHKSLHILPEPGGQEAKARMVELTQGQVVTCEPAGNRVDRYHRIVARCTVNGADLGARMLIDGRACRWRRFSGSAYAGLGRDRTRGGK